MTVSSSSFRVLYAAATLFLTDSGAWIGVSFITATVGGTGRFRQRRCRSSWDFWWCEGVGGDYIIRLKDMHDCAYLLLTHFQMKCFFKKK